MPTTWNATVDFAGDGAVTFTGTLAQSLGTSAAVSADTTGDHTLVSGIADRRIMLTAMLLVASGDPNTVTLTSGLGGTALTGAMDLVDGGKLTLPQNPAGWVVTAAGESLSMTLGADGAVTGMVTYRVL